MDKPELNGDTLSIEVRDTLADVALEQWNALCGDGNPFLRYEFLYSLECTNCLGQHNGWYPRYFLLWKTDGEKTLVGAMPAYLKTNSYGEFVFDWAWAEAYERHNLPYYPKLVCSIPFTPATGQRILIHESLPLDETRVMLANAAQQFCHSENYSGVHWLFITEKESEALAAVTLKRIDCQYHWKNNGYESFDDFLAQCTSKRRKTIKRERRHVSDAKLRLENRLGSTLNETEWDWLHELYCSTFDRKWGNPSLTAEFFKRLGSVFGENVLIVFVYDDTDEKPEIPIACSVMFIGATTLYGRYWGCRSEYHSLHFEACYYRGIEYCIENNKQFFEPGAQGEHKITRGFVPTITRSAHYIDHPGFRDAVSDFLDEERPHVEQRCEGLTSLLPFKHEDIVIK